MFSRGGISRIHEIHNLRKLSSRAKALIMYRALVARDFPVVSFVVRV